MQKACKTKHKANEIDEKQEEKEEKLKMMAGYIPSYQPRSFKQSEFNNLNLPASVKVLKDQFLNRVKDKSQKTLTEQLVNG